MTLTLLASMIGAGLLGAIGHELAHWFVWLVAGRSPQLDLWNLVVHPRMGPTTTTNYDRLAAAAPYIIGIVSLWYALVTRGVVVGMFALGIIGVPSKEDIATIFGQAEWAINR